MRSWRIACLPLAAALFGLCFLGACAQGNASPSSQGFRLVEGVPFATAGTQTLLCDLYLPDGDRLHPAVLYLHGGGWSAGDRKQLRRQAELLAENGFVGMAIDYRLAPAHPFPAALDDATTALSWLRAHAAEYHVDTSRIGAVGSSAGGNLAALLGVGANGEEKAPAQKAEPPVQAVVAFNGIFDLATMPPSNMVSNFAGGSCSVTPTLCARASPSASVRPGLPPFLLLHGTADTTAPYTQATSFAARLKASGDDVELFTAEGAPHTFWIQVRWMEPSFRAMLTFLNKTLRNEHRPAAVSATTP